MVSVAVTVVAFNGKHHLSRCLDAVLSQTYCSSQILLLDNASTDGTVEFVANRYPQVVLVPSEVNRGFAAGHNLLIRKTTSDFVLALNQDAYLSPSFVEELVRAMEAHPEVGIAGGKLFSLRNFQENGSNRNVIDMTWLDIQKNRRQVCYAQMHPDKEDWSVPRLVFAIDGAAMFLRRSMLEEIRFEEEYFDEDFSTGKEDTDISWRAQLCGWKCLYVPSAIGWHVRTFAHVDQRPTIAEGLRANSIRNRYLLMIKNEFFAHFIRHLPYIALYDLQILGYVLLREHSSLKAYGEALQLVPRAMKKRKATMSKRKVSSDYVFQWFR